MNGRREEILLPNLFKAKSLKMSLNVCVCTYMNFILHEGTGRLKRRDIYLSPISIFLNDSHRAS